MVPWCVGLDRFHCISKSPYSADIKSSLGFKLWTFKCKKETFVSMYLCMLDTLEIDKSGKVLFSIGPGFSSIPDIIKSNHWEHVVHVWQNITSIIYIVPWWLCIINVVTFCSKSLRRKCNIIIQGRNFMPPHINIFINWYSNNDRIWRVRIVTE